PPPETYKAIAAHLNEVIQDGDCIQVGVGEPSSLMPMLGAFDGKKDLGLHTELGSPGMAKLVAEGVINGSRKNQFPKRAVAAAWTGCADDDLAIINDNPTFQLFDPEYILDVRLMGRNDRQTAINSAISVDLIGQINAESVFGPRMINGTGGQPETHISAFLSNGGKAITLLPSTALEGTVSRIVAMQDAGSIITIPRYYADIVISEYGVARLLGKNHRERAEELIAIAHPDFRAELRNSMKSMFFT
ncbi:MAG TPA: acetyl-CoA hydrolase/transferase C-terminal domain-containing protein, partial [Dehalococcoidia bacterium]|nr:acetyl-CoA hydrolase/transferase C-terminal domain-containing protein [Dehalococcoidia bacterium]